MQKGYGERMGDEVYGDNIEKVDGEKKGRKKKKRRGNL